MVVEIYLDGDSSMCIDGKMAQTKFEGSQSYLLFIHDVDNFIELWYNNQLGINLKVKETLDYVFPEVIDALKHNYSTKVENGNYSISVYKHLYVNEIY